jgi:hypothetical protein
MLGDRRRRRPPEAEQRRAVMSATADQLQLATTVQDGDEAMTVMFDFVQPTVAVGRPCR